MRTNGAESGGLLMLSYDSSFPAMQSDCHANTYIHPRAVLSLLQTPERACMLDKNLYSDLSHGTIRDPKNDDG